MLHCAVGHWGSLTPWHTVSASGWVRQWQDLGERRFKEVVLDMMGSTRPAERGALVVAGAAFPTHLGMRRWLVRKLQSNELEMRIAAAYALAAHLDQDEDLAGLLLIAQMKARKHDPELAFALALQQVLSIWRSSNGSGRCDECGKAPG